MISNDRGARRPSSRRGARGARGARVVRGALGALALGLGATAPFSGCRGGGSPAPTPEIGALRGQTVLVLPVQYAVGSTAARVGGASGSADAARLADAEIAFALGERGGQVSWVTPDRQAAVLRQRPSIRVDPYALSADEVRREGSGLERIHDPLYGEIRTLAALFDARYAIWPVEISYEESSEGGRVAIRTLLLDARGGDVLWQELVTGAPGPVTSPSSLASAATAVAERVTP